MSKLIDPIIEKEITSLVTTPGPLLKNELAVEDSHVDKDLFFCTSKDLFLPTAFFEVDLEEDNYLNSEFLSGKKDKARRVIFTPGIDGENNVYVMLVKVTQKDSHFVVSFDSEFWHEDDNGQRGDYVHSPVKIKVRKCEDKKDQNTLFDNLTYEAHKWKYDYLLSGEYFQSNKTKEGAIAWKALNERTRACFRNLWK